MSKEASVSFEQFREALQRSLDYLWEDEREDYQAAMSEPEPRRHIFEELQLLAQWLGENPKEFPREPEEYNGWSNYETWCVHLWLTNEEGSYRYWKEEAERHRKEDRESERSNLAEQIRSELDEAAPTEKASVFSDLVNAALSEVDWHEIADAFLEEVQPEPGDEDEKTDQADEDDEEAYSAEEFERVKRERIESPNGTLFELGQVVTTP